eukprot:352968-Chlamydomonas_euryale.AAC.10
MAVAKYGDGRRVWGRSQSVRVVAERGGNANCRGRLQSMGTVAECGAIAECGGNSVEATQSVGGRLQSMGTVAQCGATAECGGSANCGGRCTVWGRSKSVGAVAQSRGRNVCGQPQSVREGGTSQPNERRRLTRRWKGRRRAPLERSNARAGSRCADACGREDCLLARTVQL